MAVENVVTCGHSQCLAPRCHSWPLGQNVGKMQTATPAEEKAGRSSPFAAFTGSALKTADTGTRVIRNPGLSWALRRIDPHDQRPVFKSAGLNDLMWTLMTVTKADVTINNA